MKKKMKHYYIIISILSIIVGINLSLLTWLLNQLNFNKNDGKFFSISNLLNLYDSLRINGQLSIKHLASLKDSSELLIYSKNNLKLIPSFKNSSSIIMDKNSIKINVSNMIKIKSSLNDRLLLLINNNEPSLSKIFIDQIIFRTIPSMQNRQLSIKNGSIQLLNLSSSSLLSDKSNYENLDITSYTNQINLRGTRYFKLISKNNEKLSIININNRHESILLNSINGSILINTTSIQFTPQSIRTIIASKFGRTYLTVGQLCVCKNNGRLFMAPVDNYQSQHYYHHHHHRHHHHHNVNQKETKKPCKQLAIEYCWMKKQQQQHWALHST